MTVTQLHFFDGQCDACGNITLVCREYDHMHGEYHRRCHRCIEHEISVSAYKLKWPGRKSGRFWKRLLSKARRRHARAVCRGEKPKDTAGVESICNYKLY